MLEQGDFLDNLYGMLKYPENYSKEQLLDYKKINSKQSSLAKAWLRKERSV